MFALSGRAIKRASMYTPRMKSFLSICFVVFALGEPLVAQDAPAPSVSPRPGSLRLGLFADMRYFSGPADCTLRVTAPLAAFVPHTSVLVTGDFSGWATTVEGGAVAMRRDGEVWRAEITVPEGGVLGYKLLARAPGGGAKWCVIDWRGRWRCEPGLPKAWQPVACGDWSFDDPAHFRGAVEALKAAGGVDAVIVTGDLEPPWYPRWTLDQVLGPEVPWYPVMGNHELADWTHVRWMQEAGAASARVARSGPDACPATTYAVEWGDVYLAVLDQYCTTRRGDVDDVLYEWLARDLAATDRPIRLVAGHEPAFPQPDVVSGRVRHMGDSLNDRPARRDRFWRLLKAHDVLAYLCGHTHGSSAVRINGVWQIDAGHARGAADRRAPSAAMILDVGPEEVRLEVLREVFDDGDDPVDYQDANQTLVLATRRATAREHAFQQGVAPGAGYDGAADALLVRGDPDDPAGDDDELEVDGWPEQRALLRWRLDGVPAGGRVIYAAITLSVTDEAGGAPYELRAVKRAWRQAEATWNRTHQATPWQTPGASGAEDRGEALLGTVATDEEGRFVFLLNATGRAVVEGWIQDPKSNHGLLLTAPDGTTNGLDIASSEAKNPRDRPRLEIVMARHR
jgi:hypothetical protein